MRTTEGSVEEGPNLLESQQGSEGESKVGVTMDGTEEVTSEGGKLELELHDEGTESGGLQSRVG